MSETDPRAVTLGQVSVNRDAFELDLKINEGYQAYSAELLRLALLVLTGLSAAWLQVYLPSGGPRSPVPLRMSVLFLLAFSSASLSAGAALMHRYTAADSLTYHLTALRRRARCRPADGSRPSDLDLAHRQERKRDGHFRWSARLLRSAAALLFAGLFFFSLSLASLMF